MADLKIPNLNKRSDKFFSKKKLTLRRKSKRKLKIESFLMLFSSFFWIYIVSIIPNKKIIFGNFLNNLSKLIENISYSLTYLYQICLALFIVFSLIFSFFLILGSISRLIKIAKRKTKQITYQ